MQKRLKALWEVQQVDNELDKLDELRGDLPRELTLLENKLKELTDKLDELKKIQKESLEKREENDEVLTQSKANLKKYKAQLLQIKTNREYDALMKEIDHTNELIAKLDEENNVLADQSKKYTQEIDEIIPEIDKIKVELKEKGKDLQEIDKKTEKERTTLMKKREEVISKIGKGDLSLYSRIRLAKGRAIVPVRRNACDGCYATVSSQKQLEIRRNDRLYVCESCGRILISDEIQKTKIELN